MLKQRYTHIFFCFVLQYAQKRNYDPSITLCSLEKKQKVSDFIPSGTPSHSSRYTCITQDDRDPVFFRQRLEKLFPSTHPDINAQIKLWIQTHYEKQSLCHDGLYCPKSLWEKLYLHQRVSFYKNCE